MNWFELAHWGDLTVVQTDGLQLIRQFPSQQSSTVSVFIRKNLSKDLKIFVEA
jgi:hypothetical protein